MPAIIITILTAFASSLVARLLLGAGLAFFTYDWINDLVLSAQLEMAGLLNNLPSDVLGLISILKLPQALSVIMSAIGIAAFIKASKVFLGRAS
jgi:ABC-type phosphate transport system permease subunit